MIKKTGESQYSIANLKAAPELLEIQSLMPIDPDDRERLKKDIQAHGVRDPLKVYRQGNQLYILGGYNRWQIALELKIDLVPVHEYEGTPDEYRALVIDDNLNRRQMTTEQKRKLITYFLKQDPGQSDRIISGKLNVSPSTVGTVRKEINASVQIGQLNKRTGKDGKTRKIPAKVKPVKHTAKPEIKIIKAAIKNYFDELEKDEFQKRSDTAKDKRDLIAFIRSL